MQKVEMNKWKEVKILSVFTVENTHSITLKQVVPDSGTTPYVTAQAGNNGVKMYVDCPEEWKDKGNCILIGGKTFSLSYQERDFCSNDSHNLALRMKDKTEESEERYLFLAAAVRTSLAKKYSWAASVSKTSIRKDTFYLPLQPDGKPDWSYIDSLMKTSMKESGKIVDGIAGIRLKTTGLSTKEWKEVRLRDIFGEPIRPKARRMSDYGEGDVPFVASGNYDNGVAGWVQKGADELDDGNCLTVSPLDGATFYQPVDFLARGGAGSAVLLLRNPKLDEGSGLFMAACIRKSLAGRSYSDQLNPQTLGDAFVMLPSDSGGHPDWMRMSSFMEEVLGSAGETIANLKRVR